MDLIRKVSDYEYIFDVKVKPNSKKQSILINADSYLVHLLSAPVHNKANKELINLIRKKLKISASQIQLVSGFKSNNKVIKISSKENLSLQEIIDRLSK